MAKPAPVEPVKFFVAVLWSDDSSLEQGLTLIRETFQPIDFSGTDHPFDLSDYYRREMGPRLRRRLVTLAELAPPESVGQAKYACNEIEDRLAHGGRRQVNLDVGYLDHNKVVVASFKAAGQKIHVGNGVFVDLVARYQAGRYQPFPWTFPDFRDGRFDDELAAIRGMYLAQLRKWRERNTKW